MQQCVWVRVPSGAPCRDDDFDTKVSRLSSLLLCPKLIQIRDFHTLLRIAPPLTGVKFWSPAAFFLGFGGNEKQVNRLLFWGKGFVFCNRFFGVEIHARGGVLKD